MKNGKRNTLNLEADKRFGDPTAVSDPACWITGKLESKLRSELPNKISIFRHGQRYIDTMGLDISANVEVGSDGKFYIKK
jgi:hypothetical protein